MYWTCRAGPAARVGELAQAADERDAAEIGADREARRGRRPSATGRRTSAFDATTNVSERSSTAAVSPKIETRPSSSSEIDCRWPLFDPGVEADLLDVDRAEALLDRQPPRTRRVAGPQR